MRNACLSEQLHVGRASASCHVVPFVSAVSLSGVTSSINSRALMFWNLRRPPPVPRPLRRPVPATSARVHSRSRSPRAVRELADSELSRRIAKTCRYPRCAFMIWSLLVCLDCRNYEALGLRPREVCDFLGHRCRWFLVPYFGCDYSLLVSGCARGRGIGQGSPRGPRGFATSRDGAQCQ